MEREFVAWPKTYRLFTGKGIVVTEKIDGTNACVVFDENGEMFAQSRNRIITPESDNADFAAWAHENREELFSVLGPGRHYGEWWGQKIGRTYGADRKIFSLFNVRKFYQGSDLDPLDSPSTRAFLSSLDPVLTAVPVLYEGPFSEEEIRLAAGRLRRDGSVAALLSLGKEDVPAEGVCIFFPDTGVVMKHVFDFDDKPKWRAMQ